MTKEQAPDPRMSLLDAITFTLSDANVPNAETWCKKFPFDLYNQADPVKQRIILNEEWRRILTWVDRNTEFNSFEARLCLLPFGETTDEIWYKHFTHYIVPFVRRFDILSQDW